MRNEFIVSSYNEWGPLEEVIVGVLDGASIPEWHIQLEATMPKKFWDFYKRNGGKPFPKEQIEAKKKRYHGLILNRMIKASSDYAVSYKSDPKYADFTIQIYENGTGPFEEDSHRTKPRLILNKVKK